MLPTLLSKMNAPDQEADALGFAFFRIAYTWVLLLELRQLFTFQHLVFAGSRWPPLYIGGLLLLWGMVLCFLMAGWFTRLAAALNYLISVLVLWAMPDFKYHFDYTMLSVNFLLLWLPVSAACSLDADWQRRKTGWPPPGRVSGAWVYLLAIPTLGLVYLDAVAYKLTSPVWLSGLGFWLPASLPHNAQTDLSGLLNQPGLVKAIGYGIMAFEALFLVLVWFRKLRAYLVAGGLLLHAGMGVAYPLPHLSLAMMALYLPLLPPAFWQGWRRAWLRFWRPARRKQTAKKPPAPALLPFSRRQGALVAAILLYCSLGQLLCLTFSPLFQAGARQAGLLPALQTLQQGARPVFLVNRAFLGLTTHDFFLDQPFRASRRLVTLWYLPARGRPRPLPLLSASGQPRGYCSGRIWTQWVYRLTQPGADPQALAAGLKTFSAFWLAQQGLGRDRERVFQVRVKTVAVPAAWQPDHLHRQMRQPWQVAGTIRWQGRHCRLQLSGW